MTTYSVQQTATAIVLWEGEAESEGQALDLMARDAGYADYAQACSVTGEDDDVKVFTVADKQ